MSTGVGSITSYQRIKDQYGDGKNPKVNQSDYEMALNDARQAGNTHMVEAIEAVKRGDKGVDLNGSQEKDMYAHYDPIVAKSFDEIKDDPSNKGFFESKLGKSIIEDFQKRDYNKLEKDIGEAKVSKSLKPDEIEKLSRYADVGDMIHTLSHSDTKRASISNADYFENNGSYEELQSLIGMNSKELPTSTGQ